MVVLGVVADSFDRGSLMSHAVHVPHLAPMMCYRFTFCPLELYRGTSLEIAPTMNPTVGPWVLGGWAFLWARCPCRVLAPTSSRGVLALA